MQVGANLMGIWGLSESLVEAIAFHHCPGKCSNGSFGTLTAVHLANSIDHRERDTRTKGSTSHIWKSWDFREAQYKPYNTV